MPPQIKNILPEATSASSTVEDIQTTENVDTAETVLEELENQTTQTCDGEISDDANSWQTECTGLSSRLEVVMAKGLWHDCELIVGSTAQRFQVHRVILASASPVLAKKLSDEATLTLPNVESDTFKLILDYLYADKVNPTSCDTACNIYQAAHDLVLPHLESKIKTYLLNNIAPEYALQVYEFSERFDVNELKEKALEVMIVKAKEVLDGIGVEKARADTLERMFALPELSISSELQLFNAAERWVRARSIAPITYLNNELQGTVDARPMSKKLYELNPKTAIRIALKQIRFLAIKPEDFAACDLSCLLSESDILAIALNVISSKTCMPMPDGFSTLKQQRSLTLEDAQASNHMDQSCAANMLPEVYNVKIDGTTTPGISSAPFALSNTNDDIQWYLSFSKKESKANTSYSQIDDYIMKIYCCKYIDNDRRRMQKFSFYAEIDVKIEKNSRYQWSGKQLFTEKGNSLVLTPTLNWRDVKSYGYGSDGYVRFEVKILRLFLD